MHDRFQELPQALRARSRIELLGPSQVPTLLITPEGAPPPDGPPMVFWLHGRTGWKELDPGRFLRLMRSGIAIAAPDLPGHGERFDAVLQESDHVLDVVMQMTGELDDVSSAAIAHLEADPQRVGLGGMSAGGMVAISRLTRPHGWRCAVLEATSGSWSHQRSRPMFALRNAPEIAAVDPIEHLDHWKPIPILAVHSMADEWVDWQGQDSFLGAIRHLGNPDLVEMLIFEKTGAEHEHVGFGRFSADVKERERRFYLRHLAEGLPALS